MPYFSHSFFVRKTDCGITEVASLSLNISNQNHRYDADTHTAVLRLSS